MGKSAKNGSKMRDFQNLPKAKDIHTKQVSKPPFLGIVGDKKWSPFFYLGAWSPIFCTQNHWKWPFLGEKNGISDAQNQKRRPRLIIIFFVGYKEAWYIIYNMYYICYRLFQLNLPILIWTDSRILRLWLNVTLMHFSNYNFFSIGWGLGRFPSVGRSHTQNCFGLQFIAMHKICSLWQTLGQGIARWLLHWLQPCN